MATIKDVAKMAGVSISTVSLALNTPERVSQQTRKKIMDAIRTLNYIPMKETQKMILQEQRSTSVAVICPTLIGPYFFEILRGISETLYLNKRDMILFSGDDAFDRHFPDIVRSRMYEGVILLHGPQYNEEYLNIAKKHDFPIVMCCSQTGFKGIGSVIINNDDIGKMVAEHFIKKKYTRIGILGIAPKDCLSREKMFVRVLNQNKIEIPEKWRLQCELTEAGGYQSMNKFLENNDDYPEAIFCMNDECAIGSMEAIKKYNLKIPKDIAIIGCDDLSRSKYNIPALSTVSTPKFEAGMLSVNMLLRKISGLSCEEIVLNGKLVLRESCN